MITEAAVTNNTVNCFPIKLEEFSPLRPLLFILRAMKKIHYLFGKFGALERRRLRRSELVQCRRNLIVEILFNDGELDKGSIFHKIIKIF